MSGSAPGALPSLGLSLPVDDRFTAGELVRMAVAAEQVGFEVLVVGEVAGNDALALLALIAAATESVVVGTGVIPVFGRPPALAAMGFATAQNLAPGRIFAGIGASSPTIVEDWMGLRYEHPAPRVRRYTEVLRAILAGERTAHSGGVVGSTGFRLTIPTSRIPIHIGAMGPEMLRLAGEIADGAMLALVSSEEAATKVAAVRAAAARRASETFTVSMIGPRVYCGPHVELARASMRRLLLGYAMANTHRGSFAASFGRLEAAESAWRSGDRRSALAMVDDEVVDAFCVLGSVPKLAERVHSYRRAGVDCLLIRVFGSEPGDFTGCMETIQAVGEARAELTNLPL